MLESEHLENAGKKGGNLPLPSTHHSKILLVIFQSIYFIYIWFFILTNFRSLGMYIVLNLFFSHYIMNETVLTSLVLSEVWCQYQYSIFFRAHTSIYSTAPRLLATNVVTFSVIQIVLFCISMGHLSLCARLILSLIKSRMKRWCCTFLLPCRKVVLRFTPQVVNKSTCSNDFRKGGEWWVCFIWTETEIQAKILVGKFAKVWRP